jgi:hypothetical protein
MVPRLYFNLIFHPLTTLRLIINDEIKPTMGPDRKLAYRLTGNGIKDHLEQLQ